MHLSVNIKKTIFFTLLLSIIVFAFGAISDLHLGDEVLHYRQARYILELRKWPLYDSLNQSYGNQKWFYFDPMLWHAILAGLWKITGISQITAQLYQIAYFIILVLSTYLFAKELYGERIALYSSFIAATIPIVPALSIILHIDIPLAALSAVCLVFMVKSKFLLSGLTLGALFLFKRQAYLIAPSFIVLVLWITNGTIKKRLNALSMFLITSAPFAYFGFVYRKTMESMHRSLPPSPPLPYSLPHHINYFFKEISDIKTNPFNIFFYFGIAVFLCLLIYFIKRGFIRKDIPIWVAIGIFTALYIQTFWKTILARYAAVLIPLLAVLGGKGLSLIKTNRAKFALIAICILQFITASLYTYVNRKIPYDVKSAYRYIKENTPASARIMCSRFDIPLYSERASIWNNYLALSEMPYLFWAADNNEALNILNKYNIDYLLVEKERIYDDSKSHHQLGWPRSFVEKMGNFSCLDLILEKDHVSLWQVIR